MYSHQPAVLYFVKSPPSRSAEGGELRGGGGGQVVYGSMLYYLLSRIVPSDPK